jgi:hypothetical protein
MELQKLEKRPEEITPVWVEAILMPNGEIISVGQTIGYYDKFKDYLFVSKK